MNDIRRFPDGIRRMRKAHRWSASRFGSGVTGFGLTREERPGGMPTRSLARRRGKLGK